MSLNQLGTTALTLEELLSYDGANFIESAYQVLLGREPDPEGLHYYSDKVRTGIEKMEILAQLNTSAEVKTRQENIAYLNNIIRAYQRSKIPFLGPLLRVRGFGKSEAFSAIESKLYAIDRQVPQRLVDMDKQFLQSAYRTILGRKVDPDGLQFYLASLENGIKKIEILAQLQISAEGKSRSVDIARLNRAIRQHQQGKLPFVSFFMRLAGKNSAKRTYNNSPPAILAASFLNPPQPIDISSRLIGTAAVGSRRGGDEKIMCNLDATYVDSKMNTMKAIEHVDDLLSLDSEDFIKSVYLTLLNRPADSDGRRSYLARLRHGESKIQILQEIFASPEWCATGLELLGLREALMMEGIAATRAGIPKAFQDVPYRAQNVQELLRYQGSQFVEQAYMLLLGRPADIDGLQCYAARIMKGEAKMQLLSELSSSNEAVTFGATLQGLSGSIRRYKRSKLPIVGPILRRLYNTEGDSLLDNRVRANEQQLFALQQQLMAGFDSTKLSMTSLQQMFLRGKHANARFDFLEKNMSVVQQTMHNVQQIALHAKHADERFDRLEQKFDALQHLAVQRGELIQRIEKQVVEFERLATVVTLKMGIANLRLPTSLEPRVSVIIPVYGKVDFTLQCLRSIIRNPPQIPFEVLVVDDCSPDNTAALLSGIHGLRLISNEGNIGFIRSCNRGAVEARGEYLCFLNNDTEVHEAWLDELLRTCVEFPETGLVGSKLIYPDGRLQEAGGIIWQDGSAWNFGRGQDPLLPVYNYAREVDYCSGASIVVPKALFDELGGFDQHYLPAYCEDSDLALKIRSRGLRVIYQPLSIVVHYEGITSGTDTTQGTKAYQIENSRKLFQRWKSHLLHHQPSGVDADNAKDRRATRRVLVIDHCTPTPDQDAGSLTVFNLLLLLREMDFQVTFIPEDNFLYMPEYTTALQRVGVEVLYAPYSSSVEQHLKECSERYHLTFLFRPGVVERHLKAIRKFLPKTRVLYHTVDLHFLRMAREAELQRDKEKQKAADEMKRRELAVIRAADATIVHSTVEFDLLRVELPFAKLHVFPLIMDVRGSSKPFMERRDIVFIGGYQHTPNVDAVEYFVAEIMPLLRKRLPGVRFYAVGSKPPEAMLALASEDVIFTGYVGDLTPLLNKMRVSVAPLRYGAGIKGKIGTAMAVGLPVVATSLAVEGMSLSNGENILVSDGEREFADTVARLYEDETFWNRISRNGLEFANNAWGADAARQTLDEILCNLGFNSKENSRQLSLYAPNNLALAIKKNAAPDVGHSTVSTSYKRKIEQELAIYERQIKVHDLPEIYHYWSNKYIAPMCREAGFQSIPEFFASNLLQAKVRTGSRTGNFVSVGAGNCDLEVSVARLLVDGGFSQFTLECLELNPAMLVRGKEIAEECGVLDNMRFVAADFNTWVANKHYDGVMANQSLHHVSNLEHLFDQVKIGLHVDGSFIINDMVGRNGHQRWPEALKIVNKYWNELPDSYKFNVLLKRQEAEYDNWDCSKEGFEGIRAQDVLPLLLERFPCEKFISFGNVIDIFVDRAFGHHFDPQSEWDREFIDRVHAEDERGLLGRELTPTHMMAVFAKKLHCPPHYSRGIEPALSIRHG